MADDALTTGAKSAVGVALGTAAVTGGASLLPALLIAFGPSILSGIGSFLTGDSDASRFKQELGLKQAEIDATIAIEAEKRKVDRERLKQQWDAFLQDMEFNKDKFAKGFGLELDKFGFSKKQQGFKNTLEFIKPEIEQARKERNVLRGLSGLKELRTISPQQNVLATGV